MLKNVNFQILQVYIYPYTYNENSFLVVEIWPDNVSIKIFNINLIIPLT